MFITFVHREPAALDIVVVCLAEKVLEEGAHDMRLPERIVSRELLARLDDTDRRIVELIARGLLQREAGDQIGLSQQAVSKRLKKIRKRLCGEAPHRTTNMDRGLEKRGTR